jgi:hypothetical protein
MPQGFVMVHRLAPSSPRPLAAPRVGAVQYLNTKPLVYGLAARGIDVAYDLPSRLADQLSAGLLDVALIPSIELFRGAGYRVVSDACIGWSKFVKEFAGYRMAIITTYHLGQIGLLLGLLTHWS